MVNGLYLLWKSPPPQKVQRTARDPLLLFCCWALGGRISPRGRRAGCGCACRTSRHKDLHSIEMETSSFLCVRPSYRISRQNIHNNLQTGGKRRRLGNFHFLGLQSCPKHKGTVGADAERHGPIYSDVSRTQHRLLTYTSVGSIYGKLPMLPGPDTMCSSTICCRHLSSSYRSRRSPRMCFGSSLTAVSPPS